MTYGKVSKRNSWRKSVLFARKRIFCLRQCGFIVKKKSCNQVNSMKTTFLLRSSEFTVQKLLSKFAYDFSFNGASHSKKK